MTGGGFQASERGWRRFREAVLAQQRKIIRPLRHSHGVGADP
jgi:hypothetical protein